MPELQPADNPFGWTLDPVDHHPFGATLHPVDDNPFQSDPYTAAQPPAAFHDPLGPAITKAATDFFGGPGRAAAANPYPLGSEEHEFYEQSRSSAMSQWGAETARQMIGGGTSFAARGALGTAGGAAAAQGVTLDQKLQKLEQALARGQEHGQPAERPMEYVVINNRSGNMSPVFGDRVRAEEYHSALPESLRSQTRIVEQPPVSERGARYAAQLASPPQSHVEHEFGNYFTPGHPDVEPLSRSFLVQHPQAKAIFDQHVLPHYGSEQEFADHFFAGHHSPDIEMDKVGDTLSFGGVLRDQNGKMAGTISRDIDPVAGTAHHGYLKLQPSLQGTGLAKTLLSNQMQLYQKMGLKSVDLFADIDVGSYAWAKYGFLPAHQGEWNAISQVALRRLANEKSINHQDYLAVRDILMRRDPEALWDLADMKLKLPNGQPVAKTLLMSNSWNGKLDLNNPEAMERFNAYVKK